MIEFNPTGQSSMSMAMIQKVSLYKQQAAHVDTHETDATYIEAMSAITAVIASGDGMGGDLLIKDARAKDRALSIFTHIATIDRLDAGQVEGVSKTDALTAALKALIKQLLKGGNLSASKLRLLASLIQQLGLHAPDAVAELAKEIQNIIKKMLKQGVSTEQLEAIIMVLQALGQSSGEIKTFLEEAGIDTDQLSMSAGAPSLQNALAGFMGEASDTEKTTAMFVMRATSIEFSQVDASLVTQSLHTSITLRAELADIMLPRLAGHINGLTGDILDDMGDMLDELEI